MTTRANYVKYGLSAAFVLLVAVQIFTSISSRAAQSSQTTPCSAPEYHQFDFWAGDWDSFDLGSATKNARIRVDRILDGCVLREDYQGVDGHNGQSFSLYDASRKLWHQTWVTNRGELLIIEGKFEEGEMVLSGSDLTKDGHERRVRGVWKLAQGGVRETAVTSLDGGKTWQPWFDLMFRPHRP